MIENSETARVRLVIDPEAYDKSIDVTERGEILISTTELGNQVIDRAAVLRCVFEFLGLTARVLQHLESTRAIDGFQTDEWNMSPDTDLRAEWTFNPDTGLRIAIYQRDS